jgi:hypothetical protein
MSGPSLSTKLQVALAAQAVFALGLIFYVSQTLLRHLQFGITQPIADIFVQLLAIIIPPAMLLLSFLALRSPPFNQAMRPTAGRDTVPRHAVKTCPPQATLAPASAG